MDLKPAIYTIYRDNGCIEIVTGYDLMDVPDESIYLAFNDLFWTWYYGGISEIELQRYFKQLGFCARDHRLIKTIVDGLIECQ